MVFFLVLVLQCLTWWCSPAGSQAQSLPSDSCDFCKDLTLQTWKSLSTDASDLANRGFDWVDAGVQPYPLLDNAIAKGDNPTGVVKKRGEDFGGAFLTYIPRIAGLDEGATELYVLDKEIKWQQRLFNYSGVPHLDLPADEQIPDFVKIFALIEYNACHGTRGCPERFSLDNGPSYMRPLPSWVPTYDKEPIMGTSVRMGTNCLWQCGSCEREGWDKCVQAVSSPRVRAFHVTAFVHDDAGSSKSYRLEVVLLQDHPLFTQVVAFSLTDPSDAESRYEVAQRAFMRKSYRSCPDCPRFSFGPGFASLFWYGAGQASSASCMPKSGTDGGTCWSKGFEYQHDANVLLLGSQGICLENPRNSNICGSTSCENGGFGVCVNETSLRANEPFGLIQAVDRPSGDPNAKYELRPSMIVEGFRMWTKGSESYTAVKLLQQTYATCTFANDNVALGVVPADSLNKGAQVNIRYSLRVTTDRLSSMPDCSQPTRSSGGVSAMIVVMSVLACLGMAGLCTVLWALWRRRQVRKPALLGVEAHPG